MTLFFDPFTADPEADTSEPVILKPAAEVENDLDVAGDGEVAVIQYGQRILPEELPTSVVKYVKWMAKNPAWKIDWQMSVTDHGDIFYASKDKAGDVKTPAHYEEHFWLRGYLIVEQPGKETLYVARFTAEWRSKLHPETNKASTSFVCATFWDTITEEQRFEKSLAPFQVWLGTLAPEGKILPTVRKPKAEPQPLTIQEELANGEWNAEG
jgi:hypothetical protein